MKGSGTTLRAAKDLGRKATWTLAFPKQLKKLRASNRTKRHSAEDERLYPIEARAFVQAAIERGETCPIVAAIEELRNGRKYGHPISAKLIENHHIRGRAGTLYRDQRYWMAVSKQGHRWIHSHPAEAKSRGWLGPWGIEGDPSTVCKIICKKKLAKR